MTPGKLNYTRDEIMADHDYTEPQVEAGYRLHKIGRAHV